MCWCAEKGLVLLEIETLVSMEKSLVSMTNCWSAEIVLVRGSFEKWLQLWQETACYKALNPTVKIVCMKWLSLPIGSE